MSTLLHIDSSVRAERSVSRALTARAGTEFVVIESRGGGYREGTPKHGWDHAESWIAQAVSLTGLELRIIVAELTMAADDARMAHLRPLAQESLERARAEIDALWVSISAVTTRA